VCVRACVRACVCAYVHEYVCACERVRRTCRSNASLDAGEARRGRRPDSRIRDREYSQQLLVANAVCRACAREARDTMRVSSVVGGRERSGEAENTQPLV